MNLSYLSLALVALSFGVHGQNIHFRGNANHNQEVPMTLSSDAALPDGELLASAACSVFRQEAGMIDPMSFITSITPTESIVSYTCSSLGRFLLGKRIANLKTDSDSGNPCAVDLQNTLNSMKTLIKSILDDEDACRTEIASEVAQLKDDHSTDALVLNYWYYQMIIYYSDERLKEDIHCIGKSPSGIPVYTFKYRKEYAGIMGDAVDVDGTYFGVMAQDLLELAPDAVVKSQDGYYRVDYSSIDVKHMKLA